MGAVFVPEVPSVGIANHAPVLMGDDSGEGDVVLVHEVGSEPGRAVHGGRPGARGVLAHFNTDRVAVPGTFVVGVLALLKVREALVNGGAIHGVVPSEITEGILGALERTSLQHASVGLGGSVATEILGGMDSDVARLHPPDTPTTILAFCNQGRIDFRARGRMRVGAGPATREEQGKEQEPFFHSGTIRCFGPAREFSRVQFWPSPRDGPKWRHWLWIRWC